MKKFCLPFLGFFTLIAQPVMLSAAEPAPFQFSGSLSLEWQTDMTTRADTATDERTDMNGTAELEAKLTLPAWLSLNGVAVLETVRDPAPGNDRYFDDEGLYMEALYLAWERGSYGLKAGKFGQNFGIAWDAAPGIWGTDLAEDYEIAEQMGIGGQVQYSPYPEINFAFSLSTFFADTTILAQSTFAGRGTKSISDGGPGNTEGFDSFAAAFDGDFAGVKLHVGLLNRAGDDIGGSSEQGLAIGATGSFTQGEVSVTPLVEVATLKDKGGVRGADTDYLTTAVELGWKKTTLALALTRRQAGVVDDSQIQVSLGYSLPYGIGFNVGYRRLDTGGASSDTFGILFDYGIKF